MSSLVVLVNGLLSLALLAWEPELKLTQRKKLVSTIFGAKSYKPSVSSGTDIRTRAMCQLW